jgi:mannose-6-phosphate isomerase-like protein (cupin superfamily)
MPDSPIEIVNLAFESSTGKNYENHPVARVNDHVVRISVMTDAFYWHFHPDSDETFLALEGGLIIDLEDRSIELLPGNIFTVQRGVRHRTRPLGARSVNLTFERDAAKTEALPLTGTQEAKSVG